MLLEPAGRGFDPGRDIREGFLEEVGPELRPEIRRDLGVGLAKGTGEGPGRRSSKFKGTVVG